MNVQISKLLSTSLAIVVEHIILKRILMFISPHKINNKKNKWTFYINKLDFYPII